MLVSTVFTEYKIKQVSNEGLLDDFKITRTDERKGTKDYIKVSLV